MAPVEFPLPLPHLASIPHLLSSPCTYHLPAPTSRDSSHYRNGFRLFYHFHQGAPKPAPPCTPLGTKSKARCEYRIRSSLLVLYSSPHLRPYEYEYVSMVLVSLDSNLSASFHVCKFMSSWTYRERVMERIESCSK